MVFELFDPQGDVQISSGTSLPHWYQPGVTYFITFRTADSIPTDVATNWHRRRDEWLKRHQVDPSKNNWRADFQKLTKDKRLEFYESFSREFLEYLDQGHGECVLKKPEFAQIVADSLRHFDGQRYHLGDFVVMPNHVHLLTCLIGETEVQSQCYSWKKYTATQINLRLKRHGRFWQADSFDHLVRSPEQFEAIQRYIADNPPQARLRPGEYLHWTK